MKKKKPSPRRALFVERRNLKQRIADVEASARAVMNVAARLDEKINNVSLVQRQIEQSLERQIAELRNGLVIKLPIVRE